MTRPERTHTYTDMIFDSTRWDSFRPRKGDIVVATPAKCGTTWTQMICALLVHQTPELPLPLTQLSRWLERHIEPAENIVADYEAQPWRRIVKTHTPLDGLPYYDEVDYVFCGRDPRDAFLSVLDHLANISEHTRLDALKRAGLPPDSDFPRDPNVLFPIWLTSSPFPWVWDGFPVGSVMYLTDSYWRHRDQPNIHFLHYSDLTRDLDGEMRRLSAALRIPIDETRWPALVDAARFETMKKNAARNAPGAHFGEWKSDSDFFRKARRGEWREVLSPENQAFYEKVSRERLSPELKSWLEGGRLN
ncbi:MAG: sulfotransferase domain-containing protein [Alphaproteobacteria bacterium]|nr:sulfotransferase domain-containing protein [Alphaproteobacteria bacterium]MBV9692912.1 sulfotransferase domain-containing protein [Alphaproteobacteria bacterium]